MSKDDITPQLQILRNEIDDIDSQLVDLLVKRRAVTTTSSTPLEPLS